MTIKTIFTLADAAHAAAVEKGFYSEPRSLARTVGLVTTEIGEIMEAALGPTAYFENKTITTPQRPGKVMKFTEHGTLYRWHWFLFVPYKRRYTVQEAVEYFG